MLLFLLSDRIEFPLLGYILNGAYYTAIGAGILVSAVLLRLRLIATGHSPEKITAFVATGLALAVPSGYIGSRAANMFHHPPELWSIDFFIRQFADGRMQTFYGAVLLPAVILTVLMRTMRLDIGRTWDAICVCIPMGHAFGRTGCFLAGCCWGRPVHLELFGAALSFPNPVPLYAIILNLLLFAFLHLRFSALYAGPGPARGTGRIAALYLAGYGTIRLFLEQIRTEQVVAFHLTQAQLIAAGCITAGVFLFMMTSSSLHALRTERGAEKGGST